MDRNDLFSSAPSLYFKRREEASISIALRLTRAPERFVIRITGGCGNMSAEDAVGLYDMFCDALSGYRGAILFGGTRMVRRVNSDIIVPAITEIAPLVKRQNPYVQILGVVPKPGDIKIVPEFGIVVTDDLDNDFVTIIHPDQDQCMVVQQNVDKGVDWTVEFQECMTITSFLREEAGWNSLLVSYNGGGVTEKEIMATAKLGWPVLLVNGSGRVTEKLANDQEFLASHPNVMVAEKSAPSLRHQLTRAGAVVGSLPLTLVKGQRMN